MSRLHLLQVCHRRCDECLFSANALVDAETRRRIIADARSQTNEDIQALGGRGTAFLCHKFTWRIKRYEGDEGFDEDDAQVVCRGYWDAYSEDMTIPLFLLSRMLGNVVFVDLDGRIVEVLYEGDNPGQRALRAQQLGLPISKQDGDDDD